MLLVPDILSCWRIQKWCLTAAGPTPTLQPCGMRPVWATLAAVKAVTVGRGEASLPGPWPDCCCQKESLLTLGFPLSPAPAPWPLLLTEAGFFFVGTVTVSLWQGLQPEREVKEQFIRHCVWWRASPCSVGDVMCGCTPASVGSGPRRLRLLSAWRKREKKFNTTAYAFGSHLGGLSGDGVILSSLISIIIITTSVNYVI